MSTARTRGRNNRHTRWTNVCALALLTTGMLLGTGGPSTRDLTGLPLEQLLNIKVTGATLHPQKPEDAPASVTVITAEDIHNYGYRTLTEALVSVCGFFASNNRSYQTAGVRGFSPPGDYASRFLVLVNGHNLADNIFNFELFFGPDFPIEMTLVERIEVIRGPSSALYGSNGVFATINVVTKKPAAAGALELTTGFGSFGEWKSQVASSFAVGKDARVLVSASGYTQAGESPLYLPEYNAPQTNFGQAIQMDQHNVYHLFSNLEWRNWTFTAAGMRRKKLVPVSWADTVFNDRGSSLNEERGFVEAAYTRDVAHGTLRWRTYYDYQREIVRLHYPADSGDPLVPLADDNRQAFRGKWLGSQLTYRRETTRRGTLTAGLDAKVDVQASMSANDVLPETTEYFHIDRRDKMIGAFLLHEKQFGAWTLNLGLRGDTSLYRKSFISPRVALIYRPSSAWTYKFLYGRSFRNPSAFELFFDDGISGAPNPGARPERADTVEIDVDRKLGKRWKLTTAAYAYRLKDFLIAVRTDIRVLQYQNIGRISAAGGEVELTGRPFDWLEAAGSYALQRSSDDDGTLENSPQQLGNLRFSVPITGKFQASSSMQYQSSRRSLAGALVRPVYLADVTVTSRRLLRNLDVRFGLRNAFNRRYYDPIALNPRVDTISQPGRTFFVELIVHAPK